MKKKQRLTYISDLNADHETMQVFKATERLALTELTAKLFFILLEKAPRTVSTTELANKVWGRDFVSEETLAQRVRLLRQALGDNAKSSRYIKTVRGEGYALLGTPQDKATGFPAKSQILAVSLALFVITTTTLWWLEMKQPDSTREPVENAADASGISADRLAERAGQYMSARRVEDLNLAIDLYEQALIKAPQNTNIQLGLSFALSTRTTKFDTVSADIARAEQLARKALESSDTNATAWHALAYALDGQGRVDEAISAYLRAYELNRTDQAAASSAAYLLGIRGRLYDALKLDTSIPQDGNTPRYTDTQIALALNLLGYHDAAEKWIKKAQILSPGHPVVVGEAIHAAIRVGALQRAKGLYQHIGESEKQTPKMRHLYGVIQLANGHLREAITAFEEAMAFEKVEKNASAILQATRALLDRQQGNTPSPLVTGQNNTAVTWPGNHMDAAYLYAAAGMEHEALQTIEHAVNLGWRDARMMQQLPFFKTLQNNPKYLEILGRIDQALLLERNLLNSDTELKTLLGINE